MVMRVLARSNWLVLAGPRLERGSLSRLRLASPAFTVGGRGRDGGKAGRKERRRMDGSRRKEGRRKEGRKKGRREGERRKG